MRCRECEYCKAQPFADEMTGDEGWEFYCGAGRRYREIGAGADESDALPKTSPRWCPLRPCNQQRRVVVAREG